MQVCEYKEGSDPQADMAIRARPLIQKLVRQEVEECVAFDHAEYLAAQAVDDFRDFEDQ